jgi:ADP-heptose:LPS heptosyltransferase
MIILKAIKRVLLIRLRMIGDVLLTTPALYTLRRSFPKAHITYVTGKFAKDALLNNPDIDEILVYDKAIFQRIVSSKPYDLTINFDSGELSDAICALSGARYRIGLSEKGILRFKNINLYNISPIKLTEEHDVIDSFLSLTRSLGLKDRTRKTRLYLTKDEINFAKEYLREHKINNHNIIGIHPGGHEKKKLWGTRKFAELCDELLKNSRSVVFIFQGPGEGGIVKEIYRKIKQRHRCFILPIFPLRKYASLVNRCKILIAHDRGPMHISASLGVKTIGIFTLPLAPFWFPYKERDGCIYFQKSQRDDRSVEKVLKAAKNLLFCR